MNYMAIPAMKIEVSGRLEERKKCIINGVCQHYKVTFEEIFKRCRDRHYLRPRQIIMYLLRKRLGMSWKSIGEIFNQDHTTAMHNNELIQCLMDTEEAFRDEIRYIERTIF
jgi:chromosomal replication initiator protein